MTAFFDTNVLVYAVGTDDKAITAPRLLDGGGRIGVQYLNEFANVAVNKLKLNWSVVDLLLGRMRSELGSVVPVDEHVHLDGCRLCRRYDLSIYDSMIVAATLAAECDVLYSQEMHAGLVSDGRLTIVNPFA